MNKKNFTSNCCPQTNLFDLFLNKIFVLFGSLVFIFFRIVENDLARGVIHKSLV